MNLIEWDDSLSVKIESIDDQHKVLIDMINAFYNNLKLGKDNASTVQELILRMKNYTRKHFSYEEDLFKKHNFPESLTHKKEHDSFVEKVNDLSIRQKEGKLILTLEITNFLKNWIGAHIKGADMKYSNFLIEKGVK